MHLDRVKHALTIIVWGAHIGSHARSMRSTICTQPAQGRSAAGLTGVLSNTLDPMINLPKVHAAYDMLESATTQSETMTISIHLECLHEWLDFLAGDLAGDIDLLPLGCIIEVSAGVPLSRSGLAARHKSSDVPCDLAP